jgi:serine-type D-Ala-D-Ala carboxypeptidase (penicillin-binding protein 5/6)
VRVGPSLFEGCQLEIVLYSGGPLLPDISMKPFLTTCALSTIALFTLVATGCQGLGGAVGGGGAVPEMGPVFPGIGSYVVCDTHDKKVVLAHNAEQRRPVASLTKIATAVVVLDTIAASRGSLDESLTVPATVQMLGTSSLGLQPGDQMSIRDAMHCALIGSDNYAAEALAQHLGAKIQQMTNQGGSPAEAFVTQMNALASTLGMKNTRFANAHGLDLGASSGTSTAADMARLSMHAISKGDFNFFVSQKQRKVSYRSGGAAKTFVVHNTNELLGKNRIDGVKTGTTNAAGPCLIISAPRPATVVKQADGSTLVVPHRLVVVELGASDRFNQAQQLLQSGWTSYDAWQAGGRNVATAGELLSSPTNNTTAPAR